MERDFFGQEAPKVRQRCAKSVGPAECAASRRGFGRGIGRPKPEIDIRNLALEGSRRFEEDLEPIISHAVPGWAAD